jgi:hypothetical protein
MNIFVDHFLVIYYSTMMIYEIKFKILIATNVTKHSPNTLHYRSMQEYTTNRNPTSAPIQDALKHSVRCPISLGTNAFTLEKDPSSVTIVKSNLHQAVT